MPQAIEALPDDPDALKAMLIAERARNERLVQIIKEMQRHRFGRRAETLPEDQMLLALEEAEQDEAGAAAKAEAQSANDRDKTTRKRRANRGALPAHLPRVETRRRHRRQDLPMLSLADWVGRAAWHLRPVHERLLADIRASGKIFADETRAPVLDPGRGRTKAGQIWAYARDDRPWGGADPPAVAYVYAPNRKAEQPIAHLGGFVGVLQVDGYAGYRALAAGNAVRLAFCWAHVRRRFYELAAAGSAPIASEALERIAAFYAIEKDIRGRSADERRAARQEKTRQLLASFEPWLREKLALISQKSKLAEAIRYALSRWEGLTRFVDDGCVEIDSNIVQRAMRPIALNRKNALFAGSDGGGEHWAILASLIETYKLCSVDPLAYLTDVLAKIANGHLNSEIDALLPWAYAPQPLIKDVA